MKIEKLEYVTRTYCDECGDECRGTIVSLGGKSYCEKNKCRGEWNRFVKNDRTVSAIKDQPYYK